MILICFQQFLIVFNSQAVVHINMSIKNIQWFFSIFLDEMESISEIGIFRPTEKPFSNFSDYLKSLGATEYQKGFVKVISYYSFFRYQCYLKF